MPAKSMLVKLADYENAKLLGERRPYAPNDWQYFLINIEAHLRAVVSDFGVEQYYKEVNDYIVWLVGDLKEYAEFSYRSVIELGYHFPLSVAMWLKVKANLWYSHVIIRIDDKENESISIQEFNKIFNLKEALNQ